MSGRIAAIAAVPRQGRQDDLFVGAAPAASGSRPTAARRSSRCSTSSRCSRSARSRSIRRTTTRLGRHRRIVDAQLASRSATASTNRPTAARPGRTWVCRNPSASSRSSSIRARQQHGLRVRARQAVERLGRSRPLQDDRRRQELVARAEGQRICRPGCSMMRWIRRIRTCCSPRCGISAARAGRSAPAANRPTAVAAAVCSARAMAARPGPKSPTRRTRASRTKPYGRIAVAVAPSDVEDRLRVRRIDRLGAVPFGRRRHDLGEARQEPDDGLAAVLLRQPDRRSDESGSLVQARLGLIQSLDGGKSFANVGGGTHGDFHDVWIDPTNTQHVIAGDDGGLWMSYDGGNQWWKGNNLPVSQFYHVSVDDADPYHVYGGLQDNSSWVGDSAYPGGITNARWENMYGGDGFWMFADPDRSRLPLRRGAGRHDRPRQPQHARDRATSSRPRTTTRSCAGTGTRRSRCRRTRRARSTSARSSCSARATTARPGIASRRI